MREIIVCHDRQPLVIIRNCPKWVLLTDVRRAYAKEYGFAEHQITLWPLDSIEFETLKIR